MPRFSESEGQQEMDSTRVDFSGFIRDIPDFPKPGIVFKDITPLLLDAQAFRDAIAGLAAIAPGNATDLIAAPEARGFIFGCTLATHRGSGFVPIRKPNKLPYEVASVTYDLEYGQDAVEMHVDAVKPGDRVLLVDDVLATGGTMAACAELVESRGGLIVGCLFFLELTFLDGRSKLKDYTVHSLLEV